MEESEKLQALTPEMEAKLPEYVKRGIEIGTSTKPVDVKKAEAYGKKLMAALGRPYKATIVVDGPVSAWKKVCEITAAEEGVALDADEMPSFVWPWLDGQFFSYWVAWADFYREVVGLELPDYSILADQVQFGPIYPLTDTVVVCGRPLAVHLGASGLHKEGGPAVEYADGTKVWSLNGVRVPQWLAETTAEQIDCAEFAKIDNVEVRREFVRKVGIERIIGKMDAKVLDKQGDYELLLVPLGGDTGDWPYLKMLNPSIKVWHLEAVDKACRTVQEALNWRNQSDLVPEQLT